MPNLTHRNLQPEWMDDPAVDPAELSAALTFIRRINGALGYTRATVGHLRRFSRSWATGSPITLLDVATGTADVPRAVLNWADRAGHGVRIVGLDLHAATLGVAARENHDPRLTFVRGDALALPFADGSFDYVLSGMFLHHLPEPAAVGALREMGRVARRGIVVADLHRNRRAYSWISLFTIGSSDMIRHDARVSVAGAFSVPELLQLRDAAGIGYAAPFRHFGHRIVLAGERPEFFTGVVASATTGGG